VLTVLLVLNALFVLNWRFLLSFPVCGAECNVLSELQSMRNLCLASHDDLLDCSLDFEAATQIRSFFGTDTEL